MTSAGWEEPRGWGRRVKQAPGHRPQGRRGASPGGQTPGARPLPQPGGGAAPGTPPLPTPLRGAEPRTRGSQASGSPARSRDWRPRRGHSLRPRALRPPPPGKGSGPGRRAPLSSPDRGTSGELRSVQTRLPPPGAELHTTSLPCSATSQTDRQETQRKKGEREREKKKKTRNPPTTAPPAPILHPGAGRKKGKVSTSSFLLSIPTPGRPGSQEPRGGWGGGKVGKGRSPAPASGRGRAREGKNIQQNHANAPPTWVQHTLEIEDDQDKGSQASGQHHPANSVHPHHFQQRRLHGFVLATGTGLSGRRAGAQEPGPCRAERSPGGAGQGRAGLGGGTRRRAPRRLSGPPPRARVWKAPELPGKCRDAWSRRLRAPAAPAAAPLRLPAAASALAGGRRAASSRAGRLGRERGWCGRRAGRCGCGTSPLPPPRSLLHCAPTIYTLRAGLYQMQLAAPGEGRERRRAAREEGPERRGGASRSPRPCPGIGRVQLFPGECGVCAALPQGPKSPQSPAGLGRRLEVVSAFP